MRYTIKYVSGHKRLFVPFNGDMELLYIVLRLFGPPPQTILSKKVLINLLLNVTETFVTIWGIKLNEMVFE